jgi:hypothetical protein
MLSVLSWRQLEWRQTNFIAYSDRFISAEWLGLNLPHVPPSRGDCFVGAVTRVRPGRDASALSR